MSDWSYKGDTNNDNLLRLGEADQLTEVQFNQIDANDDGRLSAEALQDHQQYPG